MDIDAIFFIGAQGAGKGTQAKLLANKIGFFYWEMGGILREESAKDTPLGKKLAELVNAGVLLSDEMLLSVVQEKLDSVPKDHGVIFDGIPRRIGQAEYLLNALKEQGRKNFVTIYLEIPKDESVHRLLRRADIEHRADDTEEKIEFRLQQFEHDTLPVVGFLETISKFIKVDGRPSIEEVYQNILTALGLK